MALPMPITYAIDTALNRVTITYRGLITPEDNLATYPLYLDDPQACPTHDYLVDLSDPIEIDSSYARMQTMVSRLTPLYANRAPGALTAIFASSDMAFGLARMYASLNAVHGMENVSVFRTKPEALAFLDRQSR